MGIIDTWNEMWTDIFALSTGGQVIVGILIGAGLVAAVAIGTYKGPR